MSFRKLEHRNTENEHVSGGDAVQCVAPVLPAKFNWAESFSLQSKAERSIDTVNAMENFRGYTRDVQKKVAGLKVAAQMPFVLVPSWEYHLGKKDGHASTLLPLGGSVDRSERLDRRTQLWLLSDAPTYTAGATYRDGPLHYFFSSKDRSVPLHAHYVSASTISKRQYLQLLQHRKYADNLLGIVPEKYLSLTQRLLYIPAYLNGRFSQYIETTVPYGPAQQDAPLELPYSLADRVARALGGDVCPFDVWEAAAMGAEGIDFLATDDALQKLDVIRTDWSLWVDNGTRLVRGCSYRVTDLSPLSAVSPMGLQGMNWHGLEWNRIRPSHGTSSSAEGYEAYPSSFSHITADSDGGEAQRRGQYLPRHHVLRSSADYGTQMVMAGEVRGHERVSGNSERELGTSIRDFAPLNEYAFVGPALYTFALPDRGLPIAAFRIAFPASRDAAQFVAQWDELEAQCSGNSLAFSDMARRFNQRREVALRGLVPQMSIRDDVFGWHTDAFVSAGFDFVHSVVPPQPLRHVVLHGITSREEGDSEPVVDYACFKHPFQTDHTAPLHLQDRPQFTQWRKYHPFMSEAAGSVETRKSGDEKPSTSPLAGAGVPRLVSESCFSCTFVDTLTSSRAESASSLSSSQLHRQLSASLPATTLTVEVTLHFRSDGVVDSVLVCADNP